MPALARNTDPISSFLAAHRIESSGIAENQRIRAFKAVKAYPGCTSRELSVLTGLDYDMLHKRLPEIDELIQGDDRKIRECRICQRKCVVWEIK